LVVAESCLLSLLGGALGLGLVSLMVPGLAKALSNFLPMFYFPPQDLLFGVGICLVLGVATGILPALAAMRLRVADSLRKM